MRFQVNADHINYGMGLISRALTAKPTKLIYEGVFIETVDKGIQLTCTDGTITIKPLCLLRQRGWQRAASGKAVGRVIAQTGRRD